MSPSRRPFRPGGLSARTGIPGRCERCERSPPLCSGILWSLRSFRKTCVLDVKHSPDLSLMSTNTLIAHPFSLHIELMLCEIKRTSINTKREPLPMALSDSILANCFRPLARRAARASSHDPREKECGSARRSGRACRRWL